MIAHYAPQYKNFAEPNGKVNGAYGPRIVGQIEDVLNILQDRKTRRAVIALYSSYDIHKADHAKDIPCTLTWNFLFENGALCLIATMRSNDIWLGMPYDIFVNTCVQRFIAAYLGVPTGWYQHQVGNLHLYDKHVQQATEALAAKQVRGPVWPLREEFVTLEDIRQLIEHEEEWRIGGPHLWRPRTTGFLRDIWALITEGLISSEILTDAYNRRIRLRRKNDAL